MVIPIGLFFTFFDKNDLTAKYKEFVRYSKTYVGGIVYNNTSQTIKITDYKYIHTLPPGKSSKEIGIFDADGLVINQPMYCKGSIHFDGVLKFCDYAKLNLVEEDKVIEIQVQNVWICKILNDFDFYNSIEDAFEKEKFR
jgi:hypothetical protein